MTTHKHWIVEAQFSEDDDRTDALGSLRIGTDETWAWRGAKRNPADPHAPSIGEEIAAARALSALAQKLLDASEADIVAATGLTASRLAG